LIISPDKEPTTPPGEGNAGLSPYIKLAVFVCVVLVVAAVFKWTSVGAYFTRDSIETTLNDMGPWAPLGFVLIYAVSTVLGVPGTILTIIGGVVFGAYVGTALIVIGATIGASGAFFVARFLARDFITEMFGKARWFGKLDKGVEDQGLYFILFIRLVPIFPFNGINFASGLTRIKFRDYFIATAIGIIPASFVFANAAAKAAMAASGGTIGFGFYLSFALLGILALTPTIYKSIKARGKKGYEQNK